MENNALQNLERAIEALTRATLNNNAKLYKAGTLTLASPITTAGITTTVGTIPTTVRQGTRISLMAQLTVNTGGNQSDYNMDFYKNGVMFTDGMTPAHQQAGTAWVGSFVRFGTVTVNPGDVITIVYKRAVANLTLSISSWYELKQVDTDSF